jgi:hypothetical protein
MEDRTRSQRIKDAGSQAAKWGVEQAKITVPAATKIVRDTGADVLRTKTGKTAVKGAAAGAAVGFALPFVSVLAGAMLGAGALVLLRAAKDKE